eukprot:1434376-Prymnesium_polylepis.2
MAGGTRAARALPGRRGRRRGRHAAGGQGRRARRGRALLLQGHPQARAAGQPASRCLRGSHLERGRLAPRDHHSRRDGLRQVVASADDAAALRLQGGSPRDPA